MIPIDDDGRGPRWLASPWLALSPLLAQVARRRPPVPSPSWTGWLGDPRNGVFLALGLALVIGGGRKWLQAARARRAVDRLAGDSPPPEAIAEGASHGRAAVVDLFRLLGSPADRSVRWSAGRALARLWEADQLVPEEEQAIVVRGFSAEWKARKRYPRSLSRPIPLAVEFGVPFLPEDGPGVRQGSLEWSWRVSGTGRASLETFSPFQPGPIRADVEVDPRDFATHGPHRLVLHARVRTIGLTSPWERELPQVPFSFEFDPNLALDALFTLPDHARGEAVALAVSLGSTPPDASDPRFLPLNEAFALGDSPRLEIRPDLPCDLAHALALEIEGVARPLPAGSVSLAQQAGKGPSTIPLVPRPDLPAEAIDRPGEYRCRAVLSPDANLAWADPAIRSAWPGEVATDWVALRVVRR